MRALTVKQPWAWAILQGGKDIENRTQRSAYRGPLAIHAGQSWSAVGELDDVLRHAWREKNPELYAGCIEGGKLPRSMFPMGAIIGVVDLVGAHFNNHGHRIVDACCISPWAQQHTKAHLVLENPRVLSTPIPCRGELGLWRPTASVLGQLQGVV